MHLHLIAKFALVGASMFDASSSVGKMELNPVLSQHGQFTAQSAGIKFGMVAGALIAEHLIEKHHPEMAKPFAFGNAAMSGVLTVTAIHNLKLK